MYVPCIVTKRICLMLARIEPLDNIMIINEGLQDEIIIQTVKGDGKAIVKTACF